MLGGRSYSCQRCGRCIRGEMYYSGGLTWTCLQNGNKAAQNEVAGQAKADVLGKSGWVSRADEGKNLADVTEEICEQAHEAVRTRPAWDYPDELRLVRRLECNFVQLITYPRDNYSFITTPSHFNEVPVSRLGE